MTHAPYRLVRRVFLVLAVPLFRLRVRGADRVPAAGAAILVAPHRSWLDPAVIGGASPRPVSFLILDSVYDKRWVRWFYRVMRAIPVSAEAGFAVRAIREALRRLRRGECIGVFPEGRVFPADRSGEFRPGVALLAVRSGAPVIPIRVLGSDRAWPHGRRWPGPGAVSVEFGRPIAPPPLTEVAGGAVEEMMSRIEQGLAAMNDPMEGDPV